MRLLSAQESKMDARKRENPGTARSLCVSVSYVKKSTCLIGKVTQMDIVISGGNDDWDGTRNQKPNVA